MPIRIAALLAIALLAQAGACAKDADPPRLSADVIGIRVSKPNPLKEPLLWPSGTTVSLLISSPLGELIHFDAVESAIDKFTDDKGSDLQARPKEDLAEKTAPAGFGHASKIDKDAKTCLLEVRGPGLPAKGAAHVRLQGTITMLCATQKKETVVENVLMKNGMKIAGPDNLELQITEMNEGSRDPRAGMYFVLRAQRELDDLAEIKFFRPDGGEMRAARTSMSTLSIQGAVKADWSYNVAERVDVATVKLYTWSDVQKKRIKVDLTADLGL